jgi:eukaryotic-like serine/threonine-protein kinase
MRLASGARLGPYEIVSLLGAGGMGEVYRARDSRIGRDVAIKILHGDVGRFEPLNHPNILAIYDVGTHDGLPYLVSELLEGETLRQRLHPARSSRKRLPNARSRSPSAWRRRPRTASSTAI